MIVKQHSGDDCILSWIEDKKPETVYQLAKMIDWKANTLLKYLRRMERDGKIKLVERFPEGGRRSLRPTILE